jgi:hypothetical protein
MALNNKTPIEVTLEKSSSGTWIAPESSTRQLQPWQRIWFVTGIIYLLVLAGSYYMLLPNQESIERKMFFSITEEVKRFDGMAFAGESPKKILKDAKSLGYGNWVMRLQTKYQIGPEGRAGFERIVNDYRDAIVDLPAKRKLGVMICIVAWMIPMSLLYATGLVIDWIRRGSHPVQGQ